jgi:AAA15 family ATPase/GTPase
MLVEFSFKNFKCFKEEAKLSLIASNYDKNTREEDNLFDVDKFGLKLLKSAVIYGANASGKTKLIEALGFMKNFIINSSKEGQIDEAIPVTPFLLNEDSENETSSFELTFIHSKVLYRYGFEVNSEKVVSEWLYHKTNIRETELFYRDEQEFDEPSKKFKVHDLIENDRIRPNALLLSVAASWNEKISKKIIDWFHDLNIISGINDSGYEGYSMSRAKGNLKNNKQVVDFLKIADLGIDSIKINTLDITTLPKELPVELRELIIERSKEDNSELLSGVTTFHRKYDENGLLKGLIEFSLEKDESSGTKKFFSLSGPILEILQNGEILFVDELANKLHPNLTYKLIELFNSKEHNTNNAQLIFNTHDTNLLSSGLFRRDQIWFTEKDRYGASLLYSLANFKTDTVRKDDNFEKNYIRGKYGAVPYLGDFDKLFTF